MSFRPISVPLVCEGVKFARLGEDEFKIKIQNFDTPYLVYGSPEAEFQFKNAPIFKNFQFPGKFG